MSSCFEALESAKISSYEPVSSQKYKNEYRTKICNFTVLFQEKPEIMNKYRPLLTACGMYVVKWESSVIDLRIWDKAS